MKRLGRKIDTYPYFDLRPRNPNLSFARSEKIICIFMINYHGNR